MIEPVLAFIDPFSLFVIGALSAGTTYIANQIAENDAEKEAARLQAELEEQQRQALLQEGAAEKYLQSIRDQQRRAGAAQAGGYTTQGSILGGQESEGGLLQ